MLALLDAVVINALIGNHDAHGKNFSRLYGAAASAARVVREASRSPAQVKKRLMAIAIRRPDLARQTVAAFDAQGQSHPILGQIVTLIDQRRALTLRRLSARQFRAWPSRP